MAAPVNDTPTSAAVHVAPSPHVFNLGMSTRTMMRDVLIALAPAVASAVYFFRWFAIEQLLICICACMIAEALFTRLRGRRADLGDLSTMVTGAILALSLPGTSPWYVGCISSVVAIGIGKLVFGGLGMNIFNPAMVGRAFVMISFAGQLAAAGYVDPGTSVDIMSQATPLTAYKQSALSTPLSVLFVGATNGSLGETSATACLLGGIFLCIRRVAAWQIPAGVLAGSMAVAGLANLADISSNWTVLHHLLGGSLLFGAFFIATDPVSSPLTAKGRWIFGIGIGVMVMVLRLFSGYPEGLMFAVLLANAVTPLINRWTIPPPFGGA